MAITVTEKWESRETTGGKDPSVDLVFLVQGTDNDIAAGDALLAFSPLVYNNLARLTAHLERTAEYAWEGTVNYGKPEEGESTWTFDTSGGTQRVTQSLDTVNSYAPSGETAPNFHGAIGVSKDNVEGVDITTPIFNFGETHDLDDTLLADGTYKLTLFGLTGKVNLYPFRGFAIGEVLFLGAQGSKTGMDNWSINYRFAASPNVVNLDLGDITITEKRGWDYLWVSYADAEDTTAKRLIKKPVAAYVEQVYEYADFSLLGIGV